MKPNEMRANWAIENATPVDLAIMKVAAAVPGPHTTNAAVPTNSAASFLEDVTSAINPARDATTAPRTSPPSGERGLETRWRSARPNNVSLSFRLDVAAVKSG